LTDTAERIAKIKQVVFGPGVNSDTRLDHLMGLIWNQPADVFWPALADTWPMCDDTWWLRRDLLTLMSRQQTRPPIAGLSFPLTIYRGGTRSRVRGLSWTTSRAVAEKFAHGHRGIRVPDPVIAEAVVEQAAVFLAIDGRNESEVLIDPRRLRKLKVHAYTPDAAVA
jgi:hypothetical protein